MINAPTALKTNTPTPTRTCAAIWKFLTLNGQLTTCLLVYTGLFGPGDIAAETGCNLENPPRRLIYFCAHPIDSNQVPQNPEFNALLIRNSRILRYKGL
jgi:hypothetical protein